MSRNQCRGLAGSRLVREPYSPYVWLDKEAVMPAILLTWVIVGCVLMLLHVVFFADIEGYWASIFWGDPVINLLTIFLWPVMLPAFLRARFLKRKLLRG